MLISKRTRSSFATVLFTAALYTASLFLASLFLASTAAGAEAAPAATPKLEAPGLGDPGQLQAIIVETGRAAGEAVVVSGRDAGQQLIVIGKYSTGQTRDQTRDVTYATSPEGVASVDKTGWLTPIKEGQTTVLARSATGQEASVTVQVTHIEQDAPVNFPNQVTPIFTKYGCNGGGCHGKASGQNGFRLSLLGFEPGEDYEHLLKEGRGRRLFPAAPERSLLLTKAVAEVPHGGGRRLDTGSPAYSVILRWIEQGMPYGNDDDPTVVRIEVFPKESVMPRDGLQQLAAVAYYSDGHTEDVTRMTKFESNDQEMAEVSETGLVETAKLTGSVAVMARYQGQVGVFRATVPLGIKVDTLPPSHNAIDDLVFDKLKKLGLPPSKIATDAAFLRRASIDIAGRLPTLEESKAFLEDTTADKRSVLIDRLLASSDYADYFANKWNAILRNKRRVASDKAATYAFHSWIRDSLMRNTPYDQFVREVITATGQAGVHPPVAWYREVKDQSAQVEDTAQLFLGLRIQCARCHHHPFEKWSQRDYYGFSAFFAQVGRKPSRFPGADRIYHRRGVAQAKNPKTGENIKPTGLGGEALEIPAEDDPRHQLADWMANPDNPFFARALVNRYWKHFFGRGLVDPEDDMRVTNPATNPALLDALAQDFIEHKFDLKYLVRTICNSQVYQLSSEPNQWNQNDKQNFSRYYPSRLKAEVLLDAINQVTDSSTRFGGTPATTRATQLPDNGFNSYFLTVFGRPESSSACECERSSEANLAQSLHLLNSAEIQGKLTAGTGRAAKFGNDKERSHVEKLRDLYLLAFSRQPTDDEIKIAMAHIEKSEKPAQAYEDIVWALINTKEFLFNH